LLIAAMITLADPSMALATGLAGLRSWLAIWAPSARAVTELAGEFGPGQPVGRAGRSSYCGEVHFGRAGIR